MPFKFSYLEGGCMWGHSDNVVTGLMTARWKKWPYVSTEQATKGLWDWHWIGESGERVKNAALYGNERRKMVSGDKFIQGRGKCDISQNLLTITIKFLMDLVLKSHCYILAHLCIKAYVYFEN